MRKSHNKKRNKNKRRKSPNKIVSFNLFKEKYRSNMYDYERYNRKGCIKEKGINRFDFNIENEMAIYKYMSGYNMTSKEWKFIEDNETLRIENNVQWRDYIRKKYREYNTNKLEELCKHLNITVSNNNVFQQCTGIIYSALASAIISTVVSLTNKSYEMKNVLSAIIYYILLALFIFILTIILVKDVHDEVLKEKIKECFCIEYKEVIESVISSKEKQEQL